MLLLWKDVKSRSDRWWIPSIPGVSVHASADTCSDETGIRMLIALIKDVALGRGCVPHLLQGVGLRTLAWPSQIGTTRLYSWSSIASSSLHSYPNFDR